MRVILFSWEYPPRVVGKLAEYVSALSTNLVKNKIDTYIVTYHDYMTGKLWNPLALRLSAFLTQ